MTTPPVHLLGMNEEELQEFARSLGASAYRGRQLFHWLYARGADSIDAMTDLAKPFRALLASRARIETLQERACRVSASDGTTKFLFGLADGRAVETVLIPPARSFEAGPAAVSNRLTLCLSTQVGCPLDCAFCATASMGFARNLTAGEIIDQVRQVRRRSERPITNVVFMGMGEPLLNFDAVMRSVELLSMGMQIAARRITVSTAGWVPGIRQLAAGGSRVKLAVSLHSALQETRQRLMPVAARYDLEELAAAIAEYYRASGTRVTYEVIFFDGVNDTEQEVDRLIRFARRTPSKVNVIPFHPVGDRAGALRPSRRMHEIVERLRQSHLTVMVRSSAGEDIDAACGQLAVRSAPLRRVSHPAPLREQLQT